MYCLGGMATPAVQQYSHCCVLHSIDAPELCLACILQVEVWGQSDNVAPKLHWLPILHLVRHYLTILGGLQGGEERGAVEAGSRAVVQHSK